MLRKVHIVLKFREIIILLILAVNDGIIDLICVCADFITVNLGKTHIFTFKFGKILVLGWNAQILYFIPTYKFYLRSWWQGYLFS